jgi:hypothetical protein
VPAAEADNEVRAFQKTNVESQNTTTDFIIKRMIATQCRCNVSMSVEWQSPNPLNRSIPRRTKMRYFLTAAHEDVAARFGNFVSFQEEVY